jgi:hypothetical protein
MMRRLLLQLNPTISLLEMLHEIRQAVKLVKNSHHVAWSVMEAVKGDGVRFGKIIAFGIVDDYVSSTVCSYVLVWGFDM